MSDHSKALVPIDSWAYCAPELLAVGRVIDVGQLAEALVYYDQVLVSVETPAQFAALCDWFICQERFDTLLALFRDGTLQVYEYSFAIAPVMMDGRYVLWNLQDECQKQPDTFEQRFLYHPDIERVIKKANQRKRLYEALRGRVIEAKADDFGEAVQEARADGANANRNALIVQAFIDELYRFKSLGRPPTVTCSVVTIRKDLHAVTYNQDFAKIRKILGDQLTWHDGSPIAGGAACNRLILSAARLGCDLYLARPMSSLAGDKLYESAAAIKKTGDVIESLEASVEFPDVRALVNDGRLDLDAVLDLRSRSERFRKWLQSEADRDRDALIAYHNEVAKDAGFKAVGVRALRMFGFVGPGALAGAVGGAFAGATAGIIGGVLGGVVSYTADIGAKMAASWRPVVFGEWMKSRVAKLDAGRSGRAGD